MPPDPGPGDQLDDEPAAAWSWRARSDRTDAAPPATSRPPCEVHRAGFERTCTACVLVKREAITVAIATVNYLTGGAVSARSQRAWMRALEAHPYLAARRSDAYRNLLAVARVIMWCGKRSPVNPAVWTSIPTRARIVAKTGLSADTVKTWVRWLREHGFLATVTEGSTPRFRPGTRCGLVDDGAGRLGAEWALTIPLAPTLEGFRELPGCDHTPDDQVVSRGSQPISGDQNPPPAGSLSDEREPATDSPVVRTREGRTTGNEGAAGTAWTWPLSATPETKIDMLKAAQALRTRSAILRKVSAKHLRSLLREPFGEKWTPNDVLHALDHRPDGTPWTFTEPPRWLPGWIRHRLAAWRTADGSLQPSLSQQRAARRQAATARQAAAAAEHRRRQACRVDADTGPAAAVRAALAAAGPNAAAALQRHEGDHRPVRLYFVKDRTLQNGAVTLHSTGQALAGPNATAPPEIGAQRSSESHAGPAPARGMTEPANVFEREVLRRHALPEESEDRRPHPSGPTPAMERAWLSRVAAQQARKR
ncbi:hypothetical protein [Nonomuraea gerenzanensis]|uniref:Uncharacterized protein n=1 Tax=Nonomuraea gerenzanensis TaxID=93944 RepID=A0A1M4BLC4_9ACTN|nr:hypothetical protein [Nonomuraea gerenzanensis]UBU19199.1 hypothetical protein LCN96_56110 [Nonomuraea gerenzanensis]SAP16352.1 hypothetical protein BN4615_P11015 [Nonomuraea gerenzanensis]